jgi:putative hydrolase of HD superfamily
MTKLLNFLLEIERLKKIPKKGWLLIGVKNPEAVSDHTFRLCIMAWFLAREKKESLDMERMLKIALIHDICEIYAGDTTPYDAILPRDKKKWPELFDQWPRFSRTEKVKRFLKKHQKEQKALMKTTSKLPPELKEEILSLWLDYQHGFTKEARFLKQVNRMETLLQALEYAQETRRRPYKSWWIGSQERVDDPILLKFMEELDKRFYQRQKAKPILAFLIEVGKLKRIPRRGWVIRGIKHPETIADHSFMVALMVWVLGQERRMSLRRALKMALIHEICAVYAGDYTPHDIFGRRLSGLRFTPYIRYDILGPRLRWRKFWQQRPRLPKETKAKRFQGIYQKETRALQALIGKLPQPLKEKILGLWKEFNEKKTREGDFVDQVNCLATFLQACQYWKENPKFPIKVFGEQVAEFISDPDLIEFLRTVKRKFKLKI